jgi:methyl acetate hydrolase
MKRIWILVAVSVLVSGCSDPVPVSTLPTLTEAAVTDIDAYLEAATLDARVPKVVALVANREQVIYQGAFGKKDSARNVDVEVDSIFNLASMTKPVTSVATMMLGETGVFLLDDPVATYLPVWSDRAVAREVDPGAAEFQTTPARNPITIRQLLSHSSGLAYNFSNRRMQDLMDITGESDPRNLPLVSDPGTAWNYSPSTAVLGDLVEAATDVPLDVFLARRIFEPLGMEDTFYVVPDSKADRVVSVHTPVEGRLVEQERPESFASVVRGDGGLYGTGPDYIRFLQMLLNGGRFQGRRLLSQTAVDIMTSNQIGTVNVETQRSTNPVVSADFPIGAGRDKFGLGFQITTSNSENPDLRAPGSYSWGGIFNTHFWVDPRREIAAVILMQQLPFYAEDPLSLYQGFEERVNKGILSIGN